MSPAEQYVVSRGLELTNLQTLGIELECPLSFPGSIEHLRKRVGIGKEKATQAAQRIAGLIWYQQICYDGSLGDYVVRPLFAEAHEDDPKFISFKGKPRPDFISPAAWEVMDKPHKPIVITEGPQKCAVLAQAGVAVIGVGGVWASRDKDTDRIILSEDLRKFELVDRIVPLGFDVDHQTNKKVMQAILRYFLLLYKIGADVRILNWPLSEGKGIDDYLARKGGTDAQTHKKELAKLMDKPMPVENLLSHGDARLLINEMRLAALAPVQIEQLCKRFARRLGLSQRTLLSEVISQPGSGAAAPKPSSDPEAWPDISECPCFKVHHQEHEVKETLYAPGTYFHDCVTPKGSHLKVTIHTRICEPLDIAAITCDRDDCEYGKLLVFRSACGKEKKWAMPMKLLAGRGEEALAALLNDGLSLSHRERSLVLEYIAETKPEARLSCATTTGWYNDRTFVLPAEVIGDAGNVWFQSPSYCNDYEHAGSCEQWQAKVANLTAGNPNLIVGISAGFAGTLLEEIHLAGAGFHLFCDSSEGKTTILHAAASVWGGRRYLGTWRATANGLEAIAAIHTDTLLVPDEIHLIEPRELDHATYALANGCGKVRANRLGGARSTARWRVFTLSSGEVSIGARLSAGGIRSKAGQNLRFLDIPALGKYGAFDDLHGFGNGGAFADALRDASQRYYGIAGPSFVRTLIQAKAKGLDVSHRHKEVFEAFGSGAANNQEQRAASVFALCALAGELASEFGLVNWEAGSAKNAALMLFGRWQEHRHKASESGNIEHNAILSAIADFIDSHGGSRFSNIDPPVPTDKEPVIRDRAGWWEDVAPGQRIYLFTKTGLGEATTGYDMRRVTRALEEAGALWKRGNPEAAVKVRTPDNRPTWLYHIDAGKLRE
jgi:putative DNA primase/helicase